MTQGPDIPPGPILYLTEDPSFIEAQIAGESIPPKLPLRTDISTDEIAPGWICFYYDETLGEHVYSGLRGLSLPPGALRESPFEVLVSGEGHGCGSSRETAPYGEMAAGFRVILAPSFAPIYAQNARNLGLLISTDPQVRLAFERGDGVPLSAFLQGLDPIAQAVVKAGGLSALSRARVEEGLQLPLPQRDKRPQNVVEKILLAHASGMGEGEAPTGLAPGDGLFVRADCRFTHDYVTAMARAQFRAAFGEDARVRDPSSVLAYRDHLTFIDESLTEEAKARGLGERAQHLAEVQEAFAKAQGIGYVGEVAEGGSEAICHTHILETVALPGQVIVGTDSHTCTAGAVGAFAFGVGSTDMANAWFTGDVQCRVPGVVKVEVMGQLGPGLSAKDAMLGLLATSFIRGGGARGKVLLFRGEGLGGLSLDERATLSNMAVEAMAMTAIVEADGRIAAELGALRGMDPKEVEAGIIRCDPDANYDASIKLNLSTVEPIVATPGDPKNGRPLSALAHPVLINMAYGGSCTGGKAGDMDAYAEALELGLAKGLRVADGVRFFIQMGSQRIRRYAEERGYLETFRRAGALIIPPSCGACIRAGPGTSRAPGEVTLSAINRNFPGRSGPGDVYLASPRIVAIGALLGRIPNGDDLQSFTQVKPL